MADNEHLPLLEHIQIDPANTARATVIWLHGLGADGHDFEPIVSELTLSDDLPIRFIFPHAPMRPVSINGGEAMRAWYDFKPNDESAGEADIFISSQEVKRFIDREADRGIPSHRILLAGFSQGGVIALHTALRHHSRLAGVVALSAYLHNFSATQTEMADANLAIPILMAHGTMDPMIHITRAATSRENLIRLGCDVRWYDYGMGHQVCREEIAEISRFFQEVLS